MLLKKPRSDNVLYFFIYVWLEFHRHAQFHIRTLQRVIRIMHYSPTLRHISAPAVCTRTLDEGVHRGDLWRSAQPQHTCAALIILLLISPTSEGWKAETTLPPPGFQPGNPGLWIQQLSHCTIIIKQRRKRSYLKKKMNKDTLNLTVNIQNQGQGFYIL